MKKASSLIELVIAIVVMGIAVMTLPLMLERTQENNAFVMQQETILGARTKLGDILTYPWDENSIQTNVVGVLDTALSDNELSRNPDINSTRRIGHLQQDKRRKFFNNTALTATTPANLGKDGAEPIPNDIDDFAKVVDFNATGGLDYRFDFNMTTTVAYISDTADYSVQDMSNFTFQIPPNTAVGSTSIKMIQLTIDGEDLTPFTLRAYSTNIGGSQLLRRTYQ